MTSRSCSTCMAWDRDQQSRNARSCPPEERLCLLGPMAVSKRASDFCFSWRPIENGHDTRKVKA